MKNILIENLNLTINDESSEKNVYKPFFVYGLPIDVKCRENVMLETDNVFFEDLFRLLQSIFLMNKFTAKKLDT